MVKKDIADLKRDVKAAQLENENLKKQMLYQEHYSSRENLLFVGISVKTPKQVLGGYLVSKALLVSVDFFLFSVFVGMLINFELFFLFCFRGVSTKLGKLLYSYSTRLLNMPPRYVYFLFRSNLLSIFFFLPPQIYVASKKT